MDGVVRAAGVPGDVGKTFSEFSKQHSGSDQRPRVWEVLCMDKGRSQIVEVGRNEICGLTV